MNIKTQILNSGMIQGGPRLAALLKTPDKYNRPSWLRNQKPAKRYWPLQWLRAE